MPSFTCLASGSGAVRGERGGGSAGALLARYLGPLSGRPDRRDLPADLGELGAPDDLAARLRVDGLEAWVVGRRMASHHSVWPRRPTC